MHVCLLEISSPKNGPSWPVKALMGLDTSATFAWTAERPTVMAPGGMQTTRDGRPVKVFMVQCQCRLEHRHFVLASFVANFWLEETCEHLKHESWQIKEIEDK